MAESSLHFNWDDFDQQINEALENVIYLPHEVCVAQETQTVEYELWLVENGWQTQEQADEHIIWWKEHHREIQP